MRLIKKVISGMNPKRIGIRGRISILFYLVIVTAVAIIGYYGYQSARNAYRQGAVNLLMTTNEGIKENIDHDFHLIPEDLKFFTDFYALKRHLYWQDLGVDSKKHYWATIVNDAFRGFLAAQNNYFQIRFLDREGQEKIKVRNERQQGRVWSQSGEQLQNKEFRDYFREAIKMDKEGMFVSKLDFNREYGEIEKPYIPVVRFAKPLIGDNNVKYGVVVLNVFADVFFSHLMEYNNNSEGRRFFVVNRKGEYLYHPDPEKSLAHLMGRKDTLHLDYKGLYERFEGQEKGHLFSHGMIISYTRIHPNPSDFSNYWYLVATVDEGDALVQLKQFEYIFFALAVGIVLLILLASRYFMHTLITPLAFVTRQLQRLGRGEVVQESIEYIPQDEIRQMLDSTGLVLTNMENLASRADIIASGDFSGSVELLSDEDRLGSSINNMTLMLRDSKQTTERQNWLKDGISKINSSLSGDLSPQELADRAVSVLGRYLEAGRGVFYVYDHDSELLELLGSYMYTEREHLSSVFKRGEGAVGQVAVELKPIALRHLTADDAPVTTGTVSLTPLYTFTYPLLWEGGLQGVIELAAFEPFNDLHRELLEKSAEVIASFLHTVLQQRQIHDLLEASEESARQAREQSHQLQKANAQMEEQQQQLQQQTEELQGANAHMEEQQQQLQQQTEELQGANAHMEEQQQQLQQQTRELQQTNSNMEEQQVQLQQKSDEVEERNRVLLTFQSELKQKAEELEQSSRYKSEFLANMSHELRTPLNSIILLSKMLAMNEDANLSEEEAKRADIIHQAGEELLRLITDILDLSKIEAGKMEVNMLPVHSEALVAECTDLFSETARDKGITFHVEDRLQAGFVTDRDKLSQILRNLLSNAFKFTNQGSVTLRIERSGQKDLPIRIAVIDTGIGIPKEKLDLIFDAFQQVDGSISREFGGTGLGLSISLRFAQLLGGVIDLQSEAGKGSEFAVLLPESPQVSGTGVEDKQPEELLAGADADDASDEEIPEIKDDRDNITPTDTVILIVDDDKRFVSRIASLNKRRGYKTLMSVTGEEGLHLAESYGPKGILLNTALADMDGAKFLRRLKSSRELRHIPVYIITGYDEGESPLRQGIAGYVHKPMDGSHLDEAEADILARTVKGMNQIIIMENAAIDIDTIAAMTSGVDVEIHSVADVGQMIGMLEEFKHDLVIMGMEEGAVAEVLDQCRELRGHNPEIPIIIYCDRPPTDEAAASLHEFTDSIILNTPHSDQRMLDNIERFLREVPQQSNMHSHEVIRGEVVKGKELKGKRILVVDDDPRNLFVITSALEQSGAEVANALNGRKALQYLEDNPVDLIFMDIMMPEMDGYEAISLIKAQEHLQRIPLIALTAKALKEDREKAFEVGADDYLSKPVDYEVLVNMARSWSERR